MMVKGRRSMDECVCIEDVGLLMQMCSVVEECFERKHWTAERDPFPVLIGAALRCCTIDTQMDGRMEARRAVTERV